MTGGRRPDNRETRWASRGSPPTQRVNAVEVVLETEQLLDHGPRLGVERLDLDASHRCSDPHLAPADDAEERALVNAVGEIGPEGMEAPGRAREVVGLRDGKQHGRAARVVRPARRLRRRRRGSTSRSRIRSSTDPVELELDDVARAERSAGVRLVRDEQEVAHAERGVGGGMGDESLPRRREGDRVDRRALLAVDERARKAAVELVRRDEQRPEREREVAALGRPEAGLSLRAGEITRGPRFAAVKPPIVPDAPITAAIARRKTSSSVPAG